ncbi:MAG: DUF2703 domain-containing protein [Bacillota bacterium]
MASSLAAAIRSSLGVDVNLKEGHGGIFEVSLDGNIVYTNNRECSRRPSNEEIVQRIKEYSPAFIKSNPGCCCSTPAMEAVPEVFTSCCPPGASGAGNSNTSCCCTDNSIATSVQPKRQFLIEFMFIDLSVCTRCQGTESSLEEAVSEVARILEATGVEVVVRKIHIQTEAQARELGFISSPTIRVNGRDIQMDVRESLCESCGDLCGDDVDCRVWVYQGKEYDTPPKAMIIDAILREVYGGSDKSSEPPARPVDIPDNLKRFFAAMQK